MNKHAQAILSFQQGHTVEALRLLEELLKAGDTSELWNDWAMVNLAAEDLHKAELGFTRALELDPENTDATANLGLLLLGRDRIRGTALLKKVLPALPEDQRNVVEALLAAPAGDGAPAEIASSGGERVLRVLVVSDTFPDPKSALDQTLSELLKTLRELGDEVTFVAREAEENGDNESTLNEAGIDTRKDDSEHLASIGREADEVWSFRELLQQNRFDVAILQQKFTHNLAIPEQYLDEIRRHSPETRIVVLGDALHAAPSQEDCSELISFEKAADLAMRQREALERADLFVLAGETKSPPPRGDFHKSSLVSELTGTTLATLRHSLLAVAPKPRAAESCSAILVETLFAERLSAQAGNLRVLGQFECYVRLAEQLLAEGKPEKALEQVRHIFGRASELMRESYFASQVFIVLKRCYRQLGETEMAERCGAEARRCVTAGIGLAPASKHRRSNGPAFSVIVPTYNRLPILRKCLDALEAQTLAAADFEVIVIDDGSADGTKEFLTGYRPSFRFQYLRQTNSGTGAARRNGVAHASGEYLLLMNDDTMCDPDLLSQHLQVQLAHPRERWALIGNFEYPAQARARALTQYFCVEPFMFPQVSMEAGCPYGYSHFITCNLSVNRQAVIEVGSFDSIYKLSEDTEMGIRLYERGYRVLYHPAAHAFHDHLPYPARNLIRRARVYGADYFYMFGRHPRVMKEWGMPVRLTAMDEENAHLISEYVEEHRQEVEMAVAAVERWDSVEFEPLLNDHPETAAAVLNLLRQAVPAIHWFYLFETMLHTIIRELGLRNMAPEVLAMHATGSAK
jgi:glycosyltransferase involved in cell wall biosynthesis